MIFLHTLPVFVGAWSNGHTIFFVPVQYWACLQGCYHQNSNSKFTYISLYSHIIGIFLYSSDTCIAISLAYLCHISNFQAVLEYLAFKLGVSRGTLVKRIKQMLRKKEVRVCVFKWFWWTGISIALSWSLTYFRMMLLKHHSTSWKKVIDYQYLCHSSIHTHTYYTYIWCHIHSLPPCM